MERDYLEAFVRVCLDYDLLVNPSDARARRAEDSRDGRCRRRGSGGCGCEGDGGEGEEKSGFMPGQGEAVEVVEDHQDEEERRWRCTLGNACSAASVANGHPTAYRPVHNKEGNYEVSSRE